jgi:hypothetical protein
MSLLRRSIAVALGLTLLQSILAAPALACTMNHEPGATAEPVATVAVHEAMGHAAHAAHDGGPAEHEQCANHHGAGECVAMSACVSLVALAGEVRAGSAAPAAPALFVGDFASPFTRALAPAVPPPRS